MSKRDSYRLHGEHIDVSYAGKDLSGCILSGTYVRVDFQNANLRRARLIGTFIACHFQGADLRGADTSAGTFVDSEITRFK